MNEMNILLVIKLIHSNFLFNLYTKVGKQIQKDEYFNNSLHQSHYETSGCSSEESNVNAL